LLKPDEREFLALVVAGNLRRKPPLTPRDLIPKSGLNEKRALYLLDKWADKGWYEYGVCVDLGWITPKGIKAFIALKNRDDVPSDFFLLDESGHKRPNA
jgi:hypothetical protein